MSWIGYTWKTLQLERRRRNSRSMLLCFPAASPKIPRAHLDPDVAVRSQGRVVEAGWRGLAHSPPEGRGRPHEHVPAEAQQRQERAQAAASVDERPVARGAELHREPHRQQQHAAEEPRHLRMPRRLCCCLRVLWVPWATPAYMVVNLTAAPWARRDEERLTSWSF